MTEGSDARAAHARLDTHEAECALRYESLQDGHQQLRDGLTELRDAQKEQNKRVWWMLIALLSLFGADVTGIAEIAGRISGGG